MKVSVIVPAYNSEKTVCVTIESLLCQTYKDVEIIVVNDGSHDRTAELLNCYGDRIKIIHKENGGVSSARNRGIEVATGEYLMFADADDICREDMIECVVNRMNAVQVDYVIAGFTKVKNGIFTDCLYGERVFRCREEILSNIETIMQNGLNSPFCKLYVTRLVRENHIRFDESLPLGEDINFNLEYLLSVGSVAYLNKSLYEYLVFNSVATTTYREDLYQCRLLSLRKMNATFEKHDIENPIEGVMNIKILYAMIFNLRKKACPHSTEEKIKRIRNVKKTYFNGPRKKLSGVYKMLELVVRLLPAGGLYRICAVIQGIMNKLPDKVRGVSV